MSEEEETRHNLRQAARFEVYAFVQQVADMYRDHADEAWKHGDVDIAGSLRQRSEHLREVAHDIRREFDIKRSTS